MKVKDIVVKAKDEKAAVAKINKEMKNAEGYGWKLKKGKGYFGKYELYKTWKGRAQGGSYGEYDIAEIEAGVYKAVNGQGAGYNGID